MKRVFSPVSLRCSKHVEKIITVETEIRLILLYEYKLDLKVNRKINAVLGEDALSEWKAQFWFSKSRTGNESLEDEAWSRRSKALDEKELRRTQVRFVQR